MQFDNNIIFKLGLIRFLPWQMSLYAKKGNLMNFIKSGDTMVLGSKK